MGPLTVLGSLQDGISSDYELLALKSALDFVASLRSPRCSGGACCSRLAGPRGAGGSDACRGAIRVLYERAYDPGDDLDGGVLLLGLGLGLLELKEIRVANMLPALIVAPLLVAVEPLWPL